MKTAQKDIDKEATKDTRLKLIETASALIWSESYNAVSVDEICRKTGVKKGSFYHFFPSKAHLAMAAMDHTMEEMMHSYDKIFSATRPPLERIKLMVQHVVKVQTEISEELGHVCGCPHATLGSELAADIEIGAQIAAISKKKAAYYKSALRDLIAEGQISPDTNVDVKANEIFAFIIGQLVMARINNDLDFIKNYLEKGLLDLIGIKNT